MLKKYSMNFFITVEIQKIVIYLIIKFIVEIQNHIKINAKKFVKYFSNIDCDVHYHLAKSQI
jgi:hypothetical protein